MPHIIVKLYPGKSDKDKEKLAQAISQKIVETTACDEAVVSVAIQDINPDEWAESVYRPDILESEDLIFKKPGYNPFK